jgi:PAS domain S-box-containing protein
MLPKSNSLLLLALIISAVVLIGAGFLNHASLRLLSETRSDSAHFKETLGALESTVNTLLDAETGQRGYLLTGKPAYLEPYTAAKKEIRSRLEALRLLTRGSPQSQEDLAELRGATQAKLDELAETLRLYDAGEHEAAARLVATDAGKQSMDRIRSITTRMTRTEYERYERALAREADARGLTAASGWATALLALLLLALLAFIVRRDTAQLRASEMQLATTMRSIGDAVIATDGTGGVTLMNPVAERLTGWKVAAARGQALESVFRIINEDTRATVESPVAKVLREGTVVGLANHTLLVNRNGTETPIADSGAPILSDKGEVLGVVLVFRDASLERDLERGMREADRRKDEFLATLSHELRNPLAPVRQALGVIRAPAVSADQVRWSVDVIERQVRNMARLLDGLLDVSRITRGTLEIRKQRVALKSVVDAAVELARPAIDSKHHQLAVEYPTDLTLNADSLRLAQVLSNLLTNAAKYTDPRGELSLTGEATATELTLTVTDNGVGISADMLPRIFEMFVQVTSVRDRAEGGLGIGLALAKGLVELHGGTITAYSAGEGSGSRLVVRLPLSSELPEAVPAPTDTPVRATAGVRVVVADDNVDAADSLAMLLGLHGHEVRVANDGATALQLLEEFRPRFAFLDIGMPELTGHEVAARVREAPWGAATVLIALTGWGQETDRRAALEAGFDYHFIKPIDIGEILSAISSHGASPH